MGRSAHNRVTVSAQDKDGLERLARYLVRSPVSLERLEIDGSIVRYRHKQAHPIDGEAFDPHDFLARLLMHVPAPRLHTVRYYGHYADAARGRRRKLADQTPRDTELTQESASGSDDRASRRRLRRQWAKLIQRIYQADPLLCTCGETMRIVSFVLEGAAIRNILRHLEQPQQPARAPPQLPCPSRPKLNSPNRLTRRATWLQKVEVCPTHSHPPIASHHDELTTTLNAGPATRRRPRPTPRPTRHHLQRTQNCDILASPMDR